jgi:hypothetical protein
LCVEPGVISAVLKLGLIKTFFPLTGFILSAFKDVLTPFFRLSVFTNATRLAVLDIVIPPSIPKNKAPPNTPVCFKKSLRLRLLISYIMFRVYCWALGRIFPDRDRGCIANENTIGRIYSRGSDASSPCSLLNSR